VDIENRKLEMSSNGEDKEEGKKTRKEGKELKKRKR
jgi:hypothetical protein